MKMRYLPGPLLIVIAAFLWAADGIIRRSLYVLPPITIVFFEHFTGLLFLSPLLIKSLREFLLLKFKDQVWMVWVALFSSVLGTLWFTTALLSTNYIPFSVVFLLQKLQPIFVIAAAAVFLREKLTRQYFAWAGIAIIAAYFVTFPGGHVILSTGDGTLKAALFAVAAAFAWGTSTVFSRMMLSKLPDLSVTTLRFFFAFLIAGLMLTVTHQAHSLGAIGVPELTKFIAIALSTGMLALYIYYKGLARTPATIATILELVFPVTAVFIDMILYHTVLSPSQYLAGAILLFTAYKLGTMQKPRLKFESKQVKGKGLGRVLGYPTINLVIPANFTAQDGIYAARVGIGRKRYMGALHFGPIPTFGDDKKSLEVFLLDASNLPKGIISTPISVELVRWLRPAMRFASPKALTKQISTDVAEVKKVLLTE